MCSGRWSPTEVHEDGPPPNRGEGRFSVLLALSERPSGLEEGEHRADPSVDLTLLAEPELLEDRGDVLLDRSLAHEEGLRDRGVAQAGGHLLQHLRLALGEPEQR